MSFLHSDRPSLGDTVLYASDEFRGTSAVKLSPYLAGHVRNKLLQYLTGDDDNFCVGIEKRSDLHPRLVCSFGSVTETSKKTYGETKARNKAILVRNLPASVDKDFLEIFFESRKKQGGGPVRNVTVEKEKQYAMVEFEEPEAVDIVMNKLPITLLDNTLDIQRYEPLLEVNETVQKLEIIGLPAQLTRDLNTMHHDEILGLQSSKPQEFNPTTVTITKEDFGSYDGKPVYRFSLKNRNNIEVQITNYGGIITNIYTPDKNGKIEDIVLGYDTFEEYKSNSDKYGGVIGRFANRIAGGSFKLDGVTYQLTKNLGPNHLHGGPTGFHKRLWDWKINNDKLVLSYTSIDGEEGYPGTVNVEVSFQLKKKNKLVIRYHAQTTKPTIINLTSNNYFNLSGQASGTLRGQIIRLAADKYLPMDWSCIPTGSVENVSGTSFDLTKDTDLGQGLLRVPGNKGFDHIYCLEKSGWMKHAARVRDPKSGRILDVSTTKPGVKLYTTHYIDGQLGKGRVTYRKYGGFALEATHYSNSPNVPSFPSPIVRPGEEYSHKTVLKFSTET